MRPWALTNRGLLERYLASYIRSLRWVLDPTHRDAAVALLADSLGLTQSVAARSYAALVHPRLGFAPDAGLDPQGLDNTVALRRETVGAGAIPRPSSDYVDLSFYSAAVKLVERG